MEFEGIGDLVERSRLSRRTIYRAIAAGDLRAYKAGNRTLIDRESSDRWLTATPIQRRVRTSESGAA
ncbi:MAG: helix-turn-helix domain-containing protein [Mycobacterium sp.]|jgi:excisionase family DNA binding protein|nr:helix-turn-helix domain-containing protein [Mycobacterium sp.]